MFTLFSSLKRPLRLSAKTQLCISRLLNEVEKFCNETLRVGKGPQLPSPRKWCQGRRVLQFQWHVQPREPVLMSLSRDQLVGSLFFSAVFLACSLA